jgi:hypothetical protein
MTLILLGEVVDSYLRRWVGSPFIFDPSFRVKRVCFKHPKISGKPTVSG